MTHFTQEDAERIRSDFALVTGVYSAGLVALERVEPQGKFMNVFMVRYEERFASRSALAAFAVLDDALNMALSPRGWTLVQALGMREEGGVLRFRVRIEKKSPTETKS